MGLNKVLDGVSERADAGMTAVLDLALSEEAEPAFDLVKLGGVGWGEMKMIPRMAQQPSFDEVGFVGGVIIEDEVELKMGGNGCVDEIKEFAKLQTAMLGKAAPMALPVAISRAAKRLVVP